MCARVWTHRVILWVNLHSSFSSTERHICQTLTMIRSQLFKHHTLLYLCVFGGRGGGILTNHSTFVCHQRSQGFHLIHANVCAITNSWKSQQMISLCLLLLINSLKSAASFREILFSSLSKKTTTFNWHLHTLFMSELHNNNNPLSMMNCPFKRLSLQKELNWREFCSKQDCVWKENKNADSGGREVSNN